MSCVSVGERVCAAIDFLFQRYVFRETNYNTSKITGKIRTAKRGLKEDWKRKKKDICQLQGFEPMTSCFCGRSVGIYMGLCPITAVMTERRIYVNCRCYSFYNIQCNDSTDIMWLNHIVSRHNHAADNILCSNYNVLRAYIASPLLWHSWVLSWSHGGWWFKLKVNGMHMGVYVYI